MYVQHNFSSSQRRNLAIFSNTDELEDIMLTSQTQRLPDLTNVLRPKWSSHKG